MNVNNNKTTTPTRAHSKQTRFMCEFTVCSFGGEFFSSDILKNWLLMIMVRF
jgi:hypothetical protein